MASGTIYPWLASLRMTVGDAWYPNGQSIKTVTPGLYRTNPNALPSEGVVGNQYGTLLILRISSDYMIAFYVGSLGQSGVYSTTNSNWHQTST